MAHSNHLGDTWIYAEELAYPAGSIRQSRRFGLVRCPDGKLRLCKLGIPDTFYTIPARMSIRGKTVAGFVSVDESAESPEYRFLTYTYRKHGKIFDAKCNTFADLVEDAAQAVEEIDPDELERG